MPLYSTDFNQILNIASSGHVDTIQNVINDTSPSKEHQNHHQFHPNHQSCHPSLRVFLMPSNLTDLHQILNIASAGHMQTKRPSKTASRTPPPVRNVHNPHRLQQQLQKCHRSLRVILMPLNPSDFNQILKIASSGSMQTIQNVIKDTCPCQEYT